MKKPTFAAKASALALTSFLLTSFANAQLFIHQPFDYANETTFLAASPLPVGIASHSGADATILETSALTYPGVVASGNGYGPLNTRSVMNVDLSTPALSSYVSGGLVGGSGTGTIYISWMIKGANNSSANTLDLKNSANPDNSVLFGTLFNGGGYRLVASGDGSGGNLSYQNSNINPSALGVDFLVARIDFGAGNTDKVSLFINQLTEGSPNLQTGSNRNAKFDQINLASFGGNRAIFDEVRVGATFSSVAPASVVAAPVAPTGLSLVVDSFSEISLTWSDNSDNEIGYNIERSPDGTDNWTQVASLGASITGYQDTGLTAETQYFYRLSAYNSGGNSAFSNVATDTTGPLPPLVALSTVSIPYADADPTVAAFAALVPGVLEYSGQGLIEEASALSYTGVPSSGNGVKTAVGRYNIQLDTSLPGYERYLSGGRIGGSGLGTLYVSWLARGINAQEANTIEFKSGTAENQGSVLVGTTFGNAFIRAMSANSLNGDIANYSDSALTPSAGTDFYVAKFTFGTGNTSLVEVFVNQTTEGTADVSTTGFAQFNTIGFTKFGPAAAPSIDEIRIGTSFEAVTGNGGSSGLTTFRANNGLPAGGSGDLLTPASDGVQNLLKYAFNMIGDGTGQAASLSTPNVSVLAADGLAGLPSQSLNAAGALTITYIRRTAASDPGVTYAVKFSNNLESFAVNPEATETSVELGGGFERVTVTDSVQAPGKRFVRVEVVGE